MDKNVLTDLQGKAYKFYRGRQYADNRNGRYYCSCYDVAKKFVLQEDDKILEAEIEVENPIVIDATLEDGFAYYENLDLEKCRLYPEVARAGLLEAGARSTDEVVQYAKAHGYDCVIVKNVREGEERDLPIYDVIPLMEECVVGKKVTIAEKEQEYVSHTYKRLDLSKYFSGEQEADGIIGVHEYDGWSVVHHMRKGMSWYIQNELRVYTDRPAAIIRRETGGKYMDVAEVDGKYVFFAATPDRKVLLPKDGCITIWDSDIGTMNWTAFDLALSYDE